MLRVIELPEGGHALILTCDTCGQHIENVEMALYTWREYRRVEYDEEDNPTSKTDAKGRPFYILGERNWAASALVDEGKIFTVHKGECHDNLEAANGGNTYRWPWMELSLLPGFLIHNLKMTFQQAEEKMKRHDEYKF